MESTSTDMKYIRKTKNDTFSIQRQINGKMIYFGTFKSLEDAIFVKSLLIKNNWDMSKFNNDYCIYGNNPYYVIKKYRNKLRIIIKCNSISEAVEYAIKEYAFNENGQLTSNYGKFIYKKDGNFVIQKSINGKNKLFARLPHLELAKSIKEMLHGAYWNISYFEDNPQILKFADFYYVIGLNNSNVLQVFGKYETIEDAELNKNINYHEYMSEYGQNIYFLHGSFHIQKWKGDICTDYGSFMSLDVAQFVRGLLEENNWDLSYFNQNNIFKFNNKFIILKSCNSKIRLLGFADSIKEAESDLIAFSIFFNEVNCRIRYLEKNTYEYYNAFLILKQYNKKAKEIARFTDLSDALVVNDILIQCGWNLNKFTLFKENIFNVDGLYYIIFETNSKIQISKGFETYEEALKEFMPSEFIYKLEDKYSIKRLKNNNLIEFGIFDSLDEAIIAKQILIKCNWDLDEIENFDIFEINNLFYPVTKSDSKIHILGSFNSKKEAMAKKKSLMFSFLINKGE